MATRSTRRRAKHPHSDEASSNVCAGHRREDAPGRAELRSIPRTDRRFRWVGHRTPADRRLYTSSRPALSRAFAAPNLTRGALTRNPPKEPARVRDPRQLPRCQRHRRPCAPSAGAPCRRGDGAGAGHQRGTGKALLNPVFTCRGNAPGGHVHSAPTSSKNPYPPASIDPITAAQRTQRARSAAPRPGAP